MRKPQRNGFVDSFNGKLRDECLDEEVFDTLAHAGSSVPGALATPHPMDHERARLSK